MTNSTNVLEMLVDSQYIEVMPESTISDTQGTILDFDFYFLKPGVYRLWNFPDLSSGPNYYDLTIGPFDCVEGSIWAGTWDTVVQRLGDV
jgi:hypothetical protein